MVDVRIKCAQTVQKILEDKVFFAELKNDFGEREVAFANMLILSALRHWCGLNEILRGFLKKKIARKHRAAEYLLLLATAELLLMETAPYAVINETVKNVRMVSDKFLSAMANAVLRKIATDVDFWRKKLVAVNPLPAAFLPLLEGYDAGSIKQIGQSVFDLPRLDISVKENPQQWAEKLEALVLPSGSLRLPQRAKAAEVEGFSEGAWWVQDAAAALPVLAMGDVSSKKVVDLCAAPGGKTAQLAAKGAEVTAVDISAKRLEKLRQNMERIGFNNVQTICADALDFAEQTAEETFDAVLLDAPCSASGTFRRHPEVLHIKTAEDVAEQATLQAKLLQKSARIVKKGGILLYSVCSISKAEGEKQVQKFLAENENFKLVPINPTEIATYGNWANELITPEGFVRTLTYFQKDSGGMDSFFICKMQRII